MSGHPLEKSFRVDELAVTAYERPSDLRQRLEIETVLQGPIVPIHVPRAPYGAVGSQMLP
jgi:hypothetical protein